MEPVQKNIVHRIISWYPSPIMRVFALVLFSLTAVSADPPPLPERWAHFIESDQGYNISPSQLPMFDSLVFRPLVPEKRIPVPLYVVEVPRDHVQLKTSRFMNMVPDTGYLTRKTVLFPFRSSETITPEKVHAHFGVKPRQIGWSAQVQGHSSHFIYGNGVDPHQLKFTVTFPDDSGDKTFNGQKMGGIAVGMSDLIESLLLAQQGVSITHLHTDFFPERLAMTLDFGPEMGKQTVVHRSLSPIRDPEIPGKLYPLHGFLGNDELIEAMAAKKGVTPEEWILQVYIPNLALFHSFFGYRIGFFVAGHTQNTTISINEDTGDIVGFVGRDAADALFFPLTLLSQGLPIPQEAMSLGLLTNEVNRSHVDDTETVASILAGYTGQAVTFSKDNSVQRSAAAQFIAHINQMGAELSGVEPLQQFTGQDRLLWNLLQVQMEGIEVHGLDQFASQISGLLRSVGKHHFRQMLIKATNHPHTTEPEDELRARFETRLGAGTVAFPYPESEDTLFEARNGSGLGFTGLETGVVLAHKNASSIDVDEVYGLAYEPCEKALAPLRQMFDLPPE